MSTKHVQVTRRQTTDAIMTTLNNDTMDYTGTENLLRLLLIEKNLSSDLRHEINEKAKMFLNGLTDDVGEFLCFELDDEEHSEDDIRTLVQCVPGALSLTDDFGGFPINSACLSDQTVSFIPVFAEEGMKLNVGGDGMRGGLLREDCEDYSGGSALKEISCNNTYISGAESEYYDTRDSRTLNVIKRLRKIGLIEKEDIRKYNLLCESCNEWSSKRFNYFADWNDHVVETVRGGGLNIILDTCIQRLPLHFVSRALSTRKGRIIHTQVRKNTPM